MLNEQTSASRSTEGLGNDLVDDPLSRAHHNDALSDFAGPTVARATPGKRGRACESDGAVLGHTGIQLGMQCKAGNNKCTLEMGKSASTELVGIVPCDICCTEPRFCRECICILCGKTIDYDEHGYNLIRCLTRLSATGICGHAAHLQCALDCQMAGVVKQSGINMEEYFCRRCDRKTDLRGHVLRLFESLKDTKIRTVAERNLRLALQITEGTRHNGNRARELQTLQTAIQMVQQGSNIQEVSDLLQSQVISTSSGGGVGSATSLLNLVSSPAKVPSLSAPPQSANVLTESCDGCKVTVGESCMDQGSLSSRMETCRSSGAPEVSASQEVLTGVSHSAHSIPPHLIPPLHLLSAGFDNEIHQALEKLQAAQRTEYALAQKMLNAKKEKLLHLHEQLDLARYELASFVSSASSETLAVLTEQISAIFGNLQKESRNFENMLSIGEGFGLTSKFLLKELFGLPNDPEKS